MLNRLKKLLPVTAIPAVLRQPPGNRTPAGTSAGRFLYTRTAEELTSTPRRKQCLKQLWENSSMPSDVYQQFCLAPVQKLLMAAQNVPAARDSWWADANGFGDLTLQFTTYAVRLYQRIYVSARCHTGRAGRTVWCMECRGVLVGTVLSPATSCTPGGGTGQRKVMAAGMSSPDEAFRFRYRQQHLQGTEAQQLAAVMPGSCCRRGRQPGCTTVPGALQNLAGAVWHQHPEMALIRSVLKTAAEEVESPLLALPVTEAVTAPLLPEHTVQPEDNVPSDSQPETSTEVSAPEMPAAVRR